MPEIVPRTSQKQREKVVELKLLNFTVCEISKETKIRKSIFSRILLRYESRGTIEQRKNPRRHTKVTKEVGKNIFRESKIGQPRKISCTDQKQSRTQILHIHAERAACELPLYARNFPTKHRSGTYGPKNRKNFRRKGAYNLGKLTCSVATHQYS